MIRKLLFYTIQLFKETVLIIILILSLIGAFSTYYIGLNIPYWVFVIIPTIGVYIASFKINQKYLADIEIKLYTVDNILFEPVRLRTGFYNSYKTSISGCFSNAGAQTGRIRNVEIVLDKINEINDKFILNQLKILINNPDLYHDGETTKIVYPISLQPGDYYDFFFDLELEIDIIDIGEIANWLNTITIKIIYEISQGGNKRKKEFLLNLATGSLQYKLKK